MDARKTKSIRGVRRRRVDALHGVHGLLLPVANSSQEPQEHHLRRNRQQNPSPQPVRVEMEHESQHNPSGHAQQIVGTQVGNGTQGLSPATSDHPDQNSLYRIHDLQDG